MLTKYLLGIYHVRGSVVRAKDSWGKMMVLAFLMFLHCGMADIHSDGCNWMWDLQAGRRSCVTLPKGMKEPSPGSKAEARI